MFVNSTKFSKGKVNFDCCCEVLHPVPGARELRAGSTDIPSEGGMGFKEERQSINSFSLFILIITTIILVIAKVTNFRKLNFLSLPYGKILKQPCELLLVPRWETINCSRMRYFVLRLTAHRGGKPCTHAVHANNIGNFYFRRRVSLKLGLGKVPLLTHGYGSFRKLTELSVNERKEKSVFNLLTNKTNRSLIKKNRTFKITNGH